MGSGRLSFRVSRFEAGISGLMETHPRSLRNFVGMTNEPVTLDELLAAREYFCISLAAVPFDTLVEIAAWESFHDLSKYV